MTIYFSDTATEAHILPWVHSMRNEEFARTFPGVRGLRFDSFARLVGNDAAGILRPATRKIEYKKQPSLHVCNGRCLGGKCGGTCECRCGGKNHGRGALGMSA